MKAIAYVYIAMTPVVIWAMDAININAIFKKNKNVQANVFYVILGLSIIYLISNFIYDAFLATQLI